MIRRIILDLSRGIPQSLPKPCITEPTLSHAPLAHPTEKSEQAL